MGFTIEDMLLVSKDQYDMKMIAGEKGWSNSISWMLMLEDLTIVSRFTGKELAVTTGLGFPSKERLLMLAHSLHEHSASGLVVNTGYYINEIPSEVIDYCNENDLPLLTVPWDIYIADMIKDLSVRIFLQGEVDEQISDALIHAIENPEEVSAYREALLPHFDLQGRFLAVVLTREGLAAMDSVERKRLAYRMQLFLTSLTHNGHFFYYDGAFIVIMNEVSDADREQILSEFRGNIRRRMPGSGFVLGVGSDMNGIRNLGISYQRAKAAAKMARVTGERMMRFDEMGLYRLLYSVKDTRLLSEMSRGILEPILAYDRKHDSQCLLTLESFLKYDGSIQKMSEEMFIHRNTIVYRMGRIKELLGCDLQTQEEKTQYTIACMIMKMELERQDPDYSGLPAAVPGSS